MAQSKKVSRRENFLDKIGIEPVQPENDRLTEVMDVFRKLSDTDQDEFVRHVLREGGIERLIDIISDAQSPGIGDIVSDSISYYNFFPIARDE